MYSGNVSIFSKIEGNIQLVRNMLTGCLCTIFHENRGFILLSLKISQRDLIEPMGDYIFAMASRYDQLLLNSPRSGRKQG